METKRDTIILELIKYLVNSEKQLPREMRDVFIHGSSPQQQPTGIAADVSEIARYQQQTNRKLDELKNSIESIYRQIQSIGSNGNGNAHIHESQHMATKPVGSGTGGDSFYEEFVRAYAETAEEKLQSFLGGGLIAQNNGEFFLWSGQWKGRICTFYLQAENNAVSHQVLSMIGSEAILSVNQDTEQAADVLLQVNRKISEYYLRYPSLPQKLRIGVCLIDKRHAKVFFAGAHTNLIQIDEEGSTIYEGSKAFAGTSPSPFLEHTVSIRRGTTFFLYGNNVSGELDKLLKKTAEESPQDKKAQLSKWLTKKNSSDAIIGFSF